MVKEDWSLYNIGTHSSWKLRMKEEDSELSEDVAENTQVIKSIVYFVTIYLVRILSLLHD